MTAALLVAGLAVCGGRLLGTSDRARAQRLLLWHGIPCVAKTVDRPEEGVLDVSCAGGRYRFRVQPLCDESVACVYGPEVACWDRMKAAERQR